MKMAGWMALAGVACGAAGAPATEWIGADGATTSRLWGIAGGLRFAVHPARAGRSFGGSDGGPRGLIRVGYPTLASGGVDRVNFIAVEPVAGGRRGYSEMETSRLDPGRPGLRIEPDGAARITRPAAGVEQIGVGLRIERFENGAEVRLVLSVRSDAPGELRIAAHAAAGSAPVERCILTATMGNYARARRLWLRDGVVRCGDLYPRLRGNGFGAHTRFPAARLVSPSGGLLAAITTDEEDPASVRPFPGTDRWHYAGVPVTQYWRTPAGAWTTNLACVVNARFTYWMSDRAIPGGAAFENFEFDGPFRDGQTVIFGVTTRPPREMGLGEGPG